MKKLCIFAHYDKDNIIDSYVINYLNEIKKLNCEIVFVSVSDVNLEYDKVKNIVSDFIVRNNVGYDFMSWKIGLNTVNNISNFEQIIFCNDSCYGPIYSLKNIFEKMSNIECDFWGITDSHQISYHLQSYFLVFNKSLVSGKELFDFIEGIEVLDGKDRIVSKYEVGLSQYLIKKGYKAGTYINSSDVLDRIKYKDFIVDKFRRIKFLLNKINDDNSSMKGKIINLIKLIIRYKNRISNISTKENSNIKFLAWDKLIEDGDPFLKVMLLRDNPTGCVNVSDFEKIIVNNSSYDVSLIYNHLKRIK